MNRTKRAWEAWLGAIVFLLLALLLNNSWWIETLLLLTATVNAVNLGAILYLSEDSHRIRGEVHRLITYDEYGTLTPRQQHLLFDLGQEGQQLAIAEARDAADRAEAQLRSARDEQ